MFHQIDRELSKQLKIHIVRFENYVKNLQSENHVFNVDKRIFEIVIIALKESRDNIKIQRSTVIIDFFKFSDENRIMFKY